jgi:hypothetical protein
MDHPGMRFPAPKYFSGAWALEPESPLGQNLPSRPALVTSGMEPRADPDLWVRHDRFRPVPVIPLRELGSATM